MTDKNSVLLQSTNHLLMVEPATFYANPETMTTNAYQVEDNEPRDVIYSRALQEFRDFRNALLAAGVFVTTVRGFENCPDMVFPNCMSTHAGGQMYLYPMYNENRRAEHSDEIVQLLKKTYPDLRDWRHYVDQDLYLESTASICRDRVNKVGYSGLSARTTRPLVEKWLDEKGYEAVIFNTRSHAGIPVYHTDCVMWIGSTLAGVCAPAIVEEDRARVLGKLSSTHAVLELSMEQLAAFCGNALEVRGHDGRRFLAMSSQAYHAFSADQIALIEAHFDGGIIHSNLSTLEKYGGGSARCCMMELF